MLRNLPDHLAGFKGNTWNTEQNIPKRMRSGQSGSQRKIYSLKCFYL